MPKRPKVGAVRPNPVDSVGRANTDTLAWSSAEEPLVSIVILNWNGLEDTKACLASIRRQTYRNFETIVVDNGSADGSAEYLATVEDTALVASERNLGFTGGHIEGLKHTTGQYIAILNNDLVLHPDWLREVVSKMQEKTDAGVVGGKLYKWNEANPVGSEENEYYTWQEVNTLDGATMTLLTGVEPCWVDSISGAALLINREAVDRVGYLDNDFFAYYEETDLIARMIRSGYRAYYTPSAKAWHKVGASSDDGGDSVATLTLKHRNRYIFAVKNFDERYLSEFLNCYRRDYFRALALRWVFRRADFKAVIGAYKWVGKNSQQVMAKRPAVLALGDSYISKLRTFKHEDVTIVIPCYNYGAYVAEAIESALRQSLSPRAVIIIDDGSTDNSLEVIERYRDDERVRIIAKDNEGVVVTKNLGLSLVNTHWVVFLDADDILPDDYIERLVDFAYENKSDLVYTDFRYFGASNELIEAGEMSRIKILRENFIHNSALVKTTTARIVGGYKEVLKDGLEDWELYLSLAKMRLNFGYAKGVEFLYRQHGQGLGRNQTAHARQVELRGEISKIHRGVKLFDYWRKIERSTLLVRVVISKLRQRKLLSSIYRRLRR